MRNAAPRILVASLALAFAGASMAQIPSPGRPATGTTTSSGTATGTGNTAAGNRVGVGTTGCQGTNGSSCSTSGAATSSTGTNTVNGATTSNADITPQAAPSTSSAATVNSDGTVPNNGAGTSFASGNGTANANGTNSNSVPTGAALGRSPGQTSSGTAVGNSSPGINAPSDSLGVAGTNANVGTNATTGNFAPGVGVAGIATTIPGAIDPNAGADAGGGVNANGERVNSIGGVGAATGAQRPIATPLYDMTTRAATARDLNKRARGQSGTVYGIAPRTDNDRTDQMPDDRIIRY